MKKPIPTAPRKPGPRLNPDPLDILNEGLVGQRIAGMSYDEAMKIEKSALEKALKQLWDEALKQQGSQSVLATYKSQSLTTVIPPTKVQAMAQAQTLEQQLVDSLWKVATKHTPVVTHEDLARHLGAGHLEGTQVWKRLYGSYAQVLCPCLTILEMNQCAGPVGQAEASARCQEAIVGETLCSLHRAQAMQTKSVFYRCDMFLSSGRCQRVASVSDAQGRHWCAEHQP